MPAIGFVTLLGLTVLLLPGGARQRSEMPLLSGRVVDGVNYRPIADASVSVRVSGSAMPLAITSTDSEGRFSIQRQGLPNRFSLTAAMQGYTGGGFGQLSPSEPAQSVDLSLPQMNSSVELQLWRFASISGVVRTSRGAPVVRGAVSALKLTHAAGYPMLSRVGMVRTDDRGAYRFFQLGAGEYLIATSPIDTAEEEREEERLRRAATDRSVPPQPRAGQVARPISIAARARPYSLFYPGTPSPGQGTVLSVGWGDDLASIDFAGGPANRFSIAGSVSSLDPQRSVRVRLHAPDDQYGLELAAATTDKQGGFLIADVAPGQYLLEVLEYPEGASKAGTQSSSGVQFSSNRSSVVGPTYWASTQVHVVDSAVAGVRLELKKAAVLSGRVAAEGATGVARSGDYGSLAILLNPVGPWRLGQLPLTRVSADGSFQTVGVPPGAYVLGTFELDSGGPNGEWHLSKLTAMGRTSPEGVVTVGDADASGIEVFLSNTVAAVTGKVTDEVGRQVPGSRVYLFPADRRHWGVLGASRMFEAVSQADGQYLIRGVPTGNYRVVAVSRPVLGWRQPSKLDLLFAKSTEISIASRSSIGRNLRIVDRR